MKLMNTNHIQKILNIYQLIKKVNRNLEMEEKISQVLIYIERIIVYTSIDPKEVAL